MSIEWTRQRLAQQPIDRLIEPPPRFNPRPAGTVRPGSATDAVYQLLLAKPDQLFWRQQLIQQTGRTRKSVDWACTYLVALRLIDKVETLGRSPRTGNQLFKLHVEPTVAKPRGRPKLPDGKRRAVVPMRIREELIPALLCLGPNWLESAVQRAVEEIA